MKKRASIPHALTCLAEAQGNMITSGQAYHLGVTPAVITRLVRDGLWRRVTSGIYCLGEETWMGRAWAGILVGGPSAALGGAAAAYLHGFREAPSRIDIWSSDYHFDRDWWVFHRGIRRARGEPPRVDAAQAAIDLCRDAHADEIVSVLNAALHTRRCTANSVRKIAEETPNLKHRSLILDILHDVSHGVESPLERRYLRDVERKHRLPEARRQVSLSIGTRSDVYYENYGLIVELDGRLGHQERWKDMHKDNIHALDGLVTLRFGWRDVADRPCEVAAMVATSLMCQGWDGPWVSCPSCRHLVA